MTTEILTLIQAQAGTQTQTSQQANNENSQPGLFENLMTALTAQPEEVATEIDTGIAGEIENELEGEIATEILQAPEPETKDTVFTFTANNSFSQSVIDILSKISTGTSQEAVYNSEAENENVSAGASTDEYNEDNDVIFDVPEIVEDVKNFVTDVKQKVNEAVDDAKDFISGKFKTLKEDFKVEDLDTEEIITQILNDEDVSAKIDALPEDTKQEVLRVINSIVSNLENSDNSDLKHTVKNLLETLSNNIQAPDVNAEDISNLTVDNADEDDETEDEDTQENEDYNNFNSFNSVGLVLNTFETVSQVKHENNINIDNAPAKPQQTQTVIRKTSREHVTENVQNEADFSEVLETTEPEDTEQNNFTGNQQQENNNSSSNQPREESNSAPRNSTARTNSNTRRVEASTSQPERSSTPRTETHSNFQSFFEGVLSNQRTAARTSPSPLSLRTSANFTQSSALRDGIINVVRFIRADGVHKANVVVDPPALGRISVELTSGTSGVEATIKVASEQVRNLIQDQLAELRMNLSQQGVQVANFTVDVQQDNSGSQQNSQYQQENNQRSFIAEADEETEEFRVDLEEGLLYWVA